MRKIVCTLLVLAVLVCVPAAGAQYYEEDISGEGSGATCGAALTWAVDGSTLFISGQGDMYDFAGGAPWSGYRNAITRVVIDSGVTYVGAYAFQDYDNLTSVDFGSTVVQIGVGAFEYCDGLTSISLPASFKKFGENSFHACHGLREIHFAGNFPRFDSNSMWDTQCILYYPSTNPWPVSAIADLEAAFQGRIEFRSSDGTDPYVATEATESYTWYPQETQAANWYPQETTLPLSDVPIIFERPTEATYPVQTVPVTEPATYAPAVPTQPQTLPPTVPSEYPQATRETFLMAEQVTRPTAAAAASATGGNSIFGVLIILLTLSILATGALLFRVTNRHGKRGNYYR